MADEGGGGRKWAAAGWVHGGGRAWVVAGGAGLLRTEVGGGGRLRAGVGGSRRGWRVGGLRAGVDDGEQA